VGAVRDEVLGRCGRSRTHDPSLSQSRPRLGCLAGTFSPSHRQIRSTRFLFTDLQRGQISCTLKVKLGIGPIVLGRSLLHGLSSSCTLCYTKGRVCGDAQVKGAVMVAAQHGGE